MPDSSIPKTEHVQTVVTRANEVVERSKLVNAAQYTHGINSTRANIEWFLKRIADGKLKNYDELNRLGDCTMKLAGYLYALKENI